MAQGIPVVGAILVSPGLDRCLLVRGWGNQGSWGFPRGKINENEPDAACAVREVCEALGLEVASGLRIDVDWTVRVWRGVMGVWRHGFRAHGKASSPAAF